LTIMRVAHIAQTEMNKTSGMSRVAWHWREAFERRGHEFIHCGSAEVGQLSHQRHFPKAALKFYEQHIQKCDIALAHEPAAGVFAGRGIPTTAVSHGLERRAWRLQTCAHLDLPRVGLKSRLIFPFWRLHGCDTGMRRAAGALVPNQDDKAFAMANYGQRESNILVFKNGVNAGAVKPLQPGESSRSVLFMATWLPRKGIHTLARAAKILVGLGTKLRWTLAGTGASTEEVLRTWPEALRDCTRVIPKFDEEDEAGLIQGSNIFVLPSFFEGQPLALLQSMAFGRCCITTNICGQKDLVQHKSNGLLFEPGNAAALATLIEESANDFSLQTTLGANARQSVKNMDWGAAAGEVVDFVEDLCLRRQTKKAV